MKSDLYSRSSQPWSSSLFASPSAEFRGAPFWCWNNRLEPDQLLRQIDYFEQMGMGGFTIHCRTGLDTPYLSDEFMNIVKACVGRAKSRGLLAWLYDEDRWPSGFAGGLVTSDPRHRLKNLVFTPTPYGCGASAAPNDSIASAGRAENGTLLARYAVELAPDGTLTTYRRLREGESPSASQRLWHAYLETSRPSTWFNHQTYVDTLSPAAIARFIEVTHERYFAAVGDDFGTAVPAIFTDEPQFTRKGVLGSALDENDVVTAWTGDLPDTFRAAFGFDILDRLPEVFWNLPGDAPSVARYRYHDHVAERFASAFADQLGQWCGRHNIALTGHMMEEPTLSSQTHSLGEAMRSLRAFQIPGIDMLCDWMELTTAKQAQSVAHQYARPGVLSELYGVTGWHFDFAGHKGQGDWQAALGVTVRVHHLSWVSMAGEAKRDYPASIFYQSPWYREYKLVEDHFARVNTALTRGRPVVRVGVFHPVESFWLAYGPARQTRLERDARETQFAEITRWLLHGLIDFNFISESLLPSIAKPPRSKQLLVGEMAYDVVIVPGLRTIRATTLDQLEAFVSSGGRVVFVGEVPDHVDAQPSDRPAKLAERCERIAFSRGRILDALDPIREIAVQAGPPGSWTDNPSAADPFLYQLCEDSAGDRYLFVVNTDRHRPRDQAAVRIRGLWSVTHLDTMTGLEEPLPIRAADGWTQLDWPFGAHGSVLLRLSRPTPSEPENIPVPASIRVLQPRWKEVARLADPVKVTLHEPNVLLLSLAQWRVNAGPWNPRQEILRIDDAARALLKLPAREGHMAQPWADTQLYGTAAPVVGTLDLRFAIQSQVAISGASLALEDAADIAISLDDQSVPSTITGHWVDESIPTVSLPDLAPGQHELKLSIPMTRKRNVEWCYLLGDFGVQLSGSHATLTAPVRTLAWGDWTAQGLPFYAGNLTYHALAPELPASASPLALEAPYFANPLLRVRTGPLDVPLAFSPYRVELPASLRPGQSIDITAFGNRANAFGFVHNINPYLRWFGPSAYREPGNWFTHQYQLRPTGILSAPIIKAFEE